MKQFNIYKSTMKYLTDKNLSLNAKGFLTIILFNDGIIGLDIQKYCTDNKETIKDALLEWYRTLILYSHNKKIRLKFCLIFIGSIKSGVK